MKGSQGGNTNTPIETTAEDKTLISAWDFLPCPIIETLAKAGVIHLNDFILLDRLSIWPLPLSDDEKGIVLQQRDLLLANCDKTFVPFPFLFGGAISSYSSLFSLMTIQQRLMLKEQNGEATIADRISSATIDVIFSMFHSAGFYAEKGVFSTSARPSVEMAKKDGMIRLWDAGLDDISAFSNALADKDARTVFDMVHAIFVGYRLSLDSLKVPVVETWYHYFPEPFMRNLYAVAEKPDDADVRKKAEQDVRTHIIDLKCYQFALRIRELDIYSHTPLPTFSDKPIYDTAQLNFVKALRDFDAKHPNSIRAFGVAIEDIKTGKTDAPTAFQDKHGFDFTDFVRESLTMPLYVRFEHPMPQLAGTGYDGIDAEEPSPWHHALRERFLETLRGHFRKRAKDARKGSAVRRLWLNAEAELLAYRSEYFNRPDDEDDFKAPQKVIDAANAAAREEWIARNDEDCETDETPSEPAPAHAYDRNAPVSITTGVVMEDGRFRALTEEELAFPQDQPSLGEYRLIVKSIGKVEPPRGLEEAARQAALSDVPEWVKDMGNQLTRIERLGRTTKKLVVQVKDRVDPFDRFKGLDEISEARRPLVHAAIDYCYKQAIVIVPFDGKPKEGQVRLSDFAATIWNMPENKNKQAGFTNLKDFKTALNEQAHRNERSFIWATKEK